MREYDDWCDEPSAIQRHYQQEQNEERFFIQNQVKIVLDILYGRAPIEELESEIEELCSAVGLRYEDAPVQVERKPRMNGFSRAIFEAFSNPLEVKND